MIHRFLPRHAGERSGNVNADGFLVSSFESAFRQGINVFGSNERGFDVDLGKLRLAVGAQIFVAETTGNLEITFHPRNHQQLLVLLGSLGQSIKFTGGQAGGYQEVACAFGRRLGKDGSLNFKESCFIQIVAHGLGSTVTDHHVAGHLRTAQVKIAVLEADVFVGNRTIQLERQNFGLVDHVQGGGRHFDSPRRQIVVRRIDGPF